MLAEGRRDISQEGRLHPAINDPSYDEWEAEDGLVKSWLINSMTDKLMAHFMQCRTGKELWDVVKWNYLDVLDTLKLMN